jgi:hypothetical protein
VAVRQWRRSLPRQSALQPATDWLHGRHATGSSSGNFATLITDISFNMNDSWDKHQKSGAANPSAETSGAQETGRVERRFTVGLSRALQLATMVARSRAARYVEIPDTLAGMYIYEWERLSKFWADRKQVEAFLQRICSISPQRWNHWIETYDRQRHQEDAELSSPWRRLMHRARSAASDAQSEEDLPYSSELQETMVSAATISPFRDTVDERTVPVLTAECLLLSIARQGESEVGRSLRESGLDIPALERAARDPRRAPHR